jgi:hypothetical protein
MPKLNPVLLSVSVLLLASLACALPNIPVTPDQSLMGTAVAQTIVAGLTQMAPSLVPVALVSETPSATLTPEAPTLTPTVTLTPTPVFTPTPLVPQIRVSLATNCRLGPGKVYDRVGALLVGQVADVVGRDPVGNYWYIRNPNSSSGFCWLWGEYATLSGNLSVLPVFTPPPTPTPVPDFKASFSGLDTCAGWWVDIRLENTGGINFKSLSLTLRDTVTDEVKSLYTDGFTNKDGCLDSVTRDNLLPGDKRTISSPAFAYDLTGNKLRATISLCSNTAQNGTCVTQVITFTP